MREWFEDGRLPCSLSVQLIWEDVLVSLTQLDATVAHQREAITEEQQKQENAAQRIQEPRAQLAAFEEDEKSSAERIQTLRAELEVFQKLDMAKLIHFSNQLQKWRRSWSVNSKLNLRRTGKASSRSRRRRAARN